jgi:hypothetical protein
LKKKNKKTERDSNSKPSITGPAPRVMGYCANCEELIFTTLLYASS